MNKPLVLTPILLCLLAGCSTSGQYRWVGYEQNLYDYYHEPAIKEKVVEAHIAAVSKPSTSAKELAPGMLAEAGTFMLEKGDKVSALEFYKLELAAWPESAKLMEALIANLEKELETKQK